MRKLSGHSLEWIRGSGRQWRNWATCDLELLLLVGKGGSIDAVLTPNQAAGTEDLLISSPLSDDQLVDHQLA